MTSIIISAYSLLMTLLYGLVLPLFVVLLDY